MLLYLALVVVLGYINAMTGAGAERIEQQQKEFTKLFKSHPKLIL
jgi:Tfp pilus assembly protein PilO